MNEELLTYWIVELERMPRVWVSVCSIPGIPFRWDSFDGAQSDAKIYAESENVPARVVEINRTIVFSV